MARLRLTLALSLLALLVVPAALHFRTAAQQINSPTAFATKADKLLQQVYRASTAQPADASAESRPGITNEQRLELSPDTELGQLSQIVGLEQGENGNIKVGLTVRLAAGQTEAELRDAGFATGARIGDIVTVEADADRLPELAALASVRKMAASVYRHVLNDRARQSVGIDNPAGQRIVGQTGRGVVVGIIDTGIDFTHGDFRKADGTTRIKTLYDVSDVRDDYVVPNPLPNRSTRRGHVYTEADINAALANPSANLVTEKDLNGHGTHVTGTAAGNGLGGTSPGTYAGMAPEADLVIVKAVRKAGSGGSFSDEDTINGLAFIQQQAAALGEPFVINMSLGGQLGPHDGTGDDERAIDNLVNGGAGRAVCIAAGNEGSDNVHATTTVPAGGSLTINFHLFGSSTTQFIDLYNRNSDTYTVTVTRPDGTTTLGPVAFVASANGPQASDQYLDISNTIDSQNGQPDIFLVFKANAPAGDWKITLKGADGHQNSPFDAWAEGDGGASDHTQFSNFVDNNSHLVASPGTSRGAITVGAYVTRSQTFQAGTAAVFTSPGPTADGRQKPEVSAPGYYLYSSRSADVADKTFGIIGTGSNAPVDATHYTGLAGTSMATPVTTGSVALLLQANRGLTNDQIKALLANNANHDGFDPAGWNPLFGFGKLNIAAALAQLAPPPPPTNPIDDTTFFVNEQYLDFLSRPADPGGLAFWTSSITQCGSDAVCIDNQRVAVSAAFFIELEFQQTGSFVYRMYKGSLNRPPSFAEFNADRSQVVGGAGLDASKQAFADRWVQRAEFLQKYPATLSPTDFVNGLIAAIQGTTRTPTFAGVDLSANRATYLATLQASGRGAVVRQIVEDAAFQSAEYNRAFVLMQYFGYLRRDPDAGGYNFWLDVLNNHLSNDSSGYRSMVRAFITSVEYRARFPR